MSEYYEFIVFLEDEKDKDSFVQQMASDVQILNSVIPSRSCGVVSEKNKHINYKLTHEEQKELKKDPRVLAVRQNYPDAKPVLFNSNRSMSNELHDFLEFKAGKGDADSLFRRLQRKKEDQPRLQSYTGDEFATVSLPASSGIDIVIVDSIVAPNHVEFTESVDPDYGSEDAAYVTKLSSTNSNSRAYAIGGVWLNGSINSDHGTHVAGTAAGKTQGWCRNARIVNSDYNLFTNLTSQGNGNYSQDILNWHNFKVAQGINRPTIVNHSWGMLWQSTGGVEAYSDTIRMSWVNSIYYRGTTYNRSSFPAWPTAELEAAASSDPSLSLTDRYNILYEHWLQFFLEKGICFYDLGNARNSASSEADVIISPIAVMSTNTNNAIKNHVDAGIITCCAAGNDSWPILDGSTSSDPNSDWHNSINFTDPNTGVTHTLEYNQGGSPANAINNDSIIIVGNMDHNNYKAMSSQCGTAITVYAPGQNIRSSIKPIGVTTENIFDEHELYVAYDGTSMASPQVCGVLGLVAQKQIADRVNLVAETISHSVTVDSVTSLGNRYKIDGSYTNAIKFYEGNTYYLAMSELDMSAHPLMLSTIPDGRVDGTVTVDSSYDYTTGVTVTETGLQFVVPVGAPDLYHYCDNHQHMGYGADNSTPNPITVSTHPTVGWPMNNANAQASGVAYLTSSSYNNLYDSNVASSGTVITGYTFNTDITIFPWAAEAGTSLRGSPNRVLFFDTDVTRCGEALDQPPCLWGESGCDDGTPDSGSDSGSDGGSDSGSDGGSDSGSDGGSDGGSDSGAEGQGFTEYSTDVYKDDIEDIINNINEKTINSRSLKNDKWWWLK